jgi:hypothetical protein
MAGQQQQRSPRRQPAAAASSLYRHYHLSWSCYKRWLQACHAHSQLLLLMMMALKVQLLFGCAELVWQLDS